ncbi:hypothetical protein BpHYR1_026637 [Brachionus plicatilis]|uniref:Uncharacterized protein n=1 Tax=Brachionus plicatilis TaxID=10195 RepID=A0A3M7RMI2_BRAPC|nr:hypothetical protein BpHYR1_026637 [Brachionus plicatilis]
MSSSFKFKKNNGVYNDNNLLVLQSLLTMAIMNTNFTKTFEGTPFVFRNLSRKLCFEKSITNEAFCRECPVEDQNDEIECFNSEIRESNSTFIVSRAVSFTYKNSDLALSNNNRLVIGQNLKSEDLLLRYYLQVQMINILENLLHDEQPIFLGVKFYNNTYPLFEQASIKCRPKKYFTFVFIEEIINENFFIEIEIMRKFLIWTEFDIRLKTIDLENVYISQALLEQIVRTIDFENFYWPDNRKLTRSNQILISQKNCFGNDCIYCASTAGDFSTANCSCTFEQSLRKKRRIKRDDTNINSSDGITDMDSDITTPINQAENNIVSTLRDTIDGLGNTDSNDGSNDGTTDMDSDITTPINQAENNIVSTLRDTIDGLGNTDSNDGSDDGSNDGATDMDSDITTPINQAENNIVSTLRDTIDGLGNTDSNDGSDDGSNDGTTDMDSDITTPINQAENNIVSTLRDTIDGLGNTDSNDGSDDGTTDMDSDLDLSTNEEGNNIFSTLRNTLSDLGNTDSNDGTTDFVVGSSEENLFISDPTDPNFYFSTQKLLTNELNTDLFGTFSTNLEDFTQFPTQLTSSNIQTEANTDPNFFFTSDIIPVTSQFDFSFDFSMPTNSLQTPIDSTLFSTTEALKDSSTATQMVLAECEVFSNRLVNISVYDFVTINLNELPIDKIQENLQFIEAKFKQLLKDPVGLVAKVDDYVKMRHTVGDGQVISTMDLNFAPLNDKASRSLQLLVMNTIKSINITEEFFGSIFSISLNGLSLVEQNFCDNNNQCSSCVSTLTNSEINCSNAQ